MCRLHIRKKCTSQFANSTFSFANLMCIFYIFFFHFFNILLIISFDFLKFCSPFIFSPFFSKPTFFFHHSHLPKYAFLRFLFHVIIIFFTKNSSFNSLNHPYFCCFPLGKKGSTSLPDFHLRILVHLPSNQHICANTQ